MSRVLGISAYYHESAAALVVDGEVRGALAEERISRVKQDPRLPLDAARTILASAGVRPEELDAVVFYEDPYLKLERALVTGLRGLPGSRRWLTAALRSQLGSRLWVMDALAAGLSVPRERVSFVGHHHSHAAAGFFTSRFDHAAVLVVDGVGEEVTTSIWEGRGDALKVRSELTFPNSLGLVYAGITAFLGFRVNEGEQIVMGLAAYGEDRFGAAMSELVTLRPDGAFVVRGSAFADFLDVDRGFGEGVVKRFGAPRPPGRPWDLTTRDDRRYADVAASLQKRTEEALLGLAREARRVTEAKHLCLAGGVALNAVANARIAAETGFEAIYVQPAAGDAGGALGAAILGAMARGDRRPGPLTRADLGSGLDLARARAVAGHLGFRVREVTDPGGEIASRLRAGEILACAEGRCEWGPRALGHRSILADPSRPDAKERLNRAVKHREPFRPFAAAVRSEDLPALFEGDADDLTRFMTTVRRARSPEAIPAAVHVDGTSRVQSVDPDGAPLLRATLDALGPGSVVLNTSLNGAGDPIAASAADALAFLLAHPVDALYLGDLCVERGE